MKGLKLLVGSVDDVDQEWLVAQGLHYEVGKRTILDQASLTVRSGQSVAVTGPSGSGKTTLLLCLAGLLPLTAGQIRFGKTELTRLRTREKTSFRLGHIGIVYQFGELIPELSPMENVALPGLLAGLGRSEAQDRALSLMAELGVADLAAGQTTTLSGGERQRVAVARALINKPKLLLADEPTGSLDSSATDIVADLLFQIPQQRDCALVIVTHNPRVAQRADQQWHLDSGKLTEAGT